MAAVGIRVMRGPDWSGGDVDGGEGHLGTITSYAEDKTCTVIWDNGKVTISSAGKGNKFDLRIVDNAPIGVRHKDKVCDGCGEKDIIGMRWSCRTCEDLHLCSLCYLMGKHDRSHDFVRKDTATSEGREVPARTCSTLIKTHGLFPGAVVVRGVNWDQDDKDGGQGKAGKVTRIISHDSKSYRSAVTVAWETGETTTCRVGHKGQVDVQCLQPAPGPVCYPQHLPVLDSTYAELSQEEISSAEAAGEHPAKIEKGNAVRIIDDLEKVKRLQKGHGGWAPPMKKILGKVGEVVHVHSHGDVNVRFGKKVFVFNPACCLPASKSELPSHSLGLADDIFKLALKKTLKDIQKEEKTTETGKAEGAKEFLEAVEKSDVEEVKKISEKYPRLIKLNPPNGLTCLNIAAREGKLEIVKYLLERGSELNVTDSVGNTALMLAMIRKHVDVVKFLLEKNADTEVVNNIGQTTLHLAVHTGDPSIVHDLIRRGSDVNSTDKSGDTPLHDAIRENEIYCAQVLLMCPDIDLTITNEKGFNPLHSDAFHGKSGGQLTKKILMRNRDLVNVKVNEDESALHIAAINNHTAEAKVLISQGADVNMKNDELDATPLHHACNRAFLDAAKLLISEGAEINVGDSNKDTPLHLVMGKYQQKLSKEHWGPTHNRVQVAKFLIEKGADVDMKNEDGKTPFEVCTNETLKKSVKNFLEGGDDSSKAPSDILLCCECFTRQVDVTFPCSHKMMCAQCADNVTTCPLCGAHV